jgi:hypothetical protein
MNRKGKARVLVLVIGIVVALALATHVEAISNGFIDTNNTYSNVGAFIGKRPDGTIFRFCSGTLIAPTVFLTAAHCAHFFAEFIAGDGTEPFVSFDNPIPIEELTSPSTNLIPVTQIVADPNYVEADHHVFNPNHSGDPGDLAVLILPTLSTRGITPATLPTQGLLDELASKNGLHGVVFTSVGYGVLDRFFTDTNPVSRRYALSNFSALEVGMLQLSINPSLNAGGACAADSGGPDFLDLAGKRIIVATSSIAGDHVCRATSGNYRLDTPAARDFLKDFVTLP